MSLLSAFLEGIVEIENLSPLSRNILASSAMVLYYKIAIELACFIRKNWADHHHDLSGLSRNFLHISFSFMLLFWPYFDTSDGWSWKLSALLPAVMFSRLVYKGVFVRDAGDADVQNMSLSGSPSDLLLGPLLLAGVFVWLTLYQFMTEEAAIVAAVSFGDGCAPLVGSLYGRHFYSTPVSRIKTVEGSVVGVFLGTVTACYFNMYAMGLPFLPLRLILAYGIIAAVAEGTAPFNLDNLVTPLVLHFSIDLVDELLPDFG
jgi:dolichol kinase